MNEPTQESQCAVEDNEALLAQAEYYDAQSKIQSVQPAQAKDKAVADLTAACYQKASQLKFTREEIEALKADFTDDCFQPGAAGKENLIYIEHASLRERLDNVIGMGQWVIIPIRRWVGDFTYEKEIWENNRRTGRFENVKGSHVYVDAIMVIRECFCASAIGEMTYYPDNHTQNYGDAVEGAETAALRRCCKRLGIGLQAWRKDWCVGWWQRRDAAKRSPKAVQRAEPAKPPQATTQATKTPPSPSSAPGKPLSEADQKKLDDWNKYRMKLLNKLDAAPGQRNRVLLTDYLTSEGVLTVEQVLEDWPIASLPTTKEATSGLIAGMQDYEMQRNQEGAA